MKKVYFSLILVCLGLSIQAISQTTTFTTAGGPYSYVVPAGVTSVAIDMAGGKGGDGSPCTPYGFGGYGGRVQCTMAVTPGTTLYVFVGGAGTQAPCCCTYGVAGGAGGGGNSQEFYAAAGGGASDIRTSTGTYTSTLSSRLVVAGGGGGAGYGSCCSSTYNSGGNGGGTTGQGGFFYGSSTYSTCYNPGGGTQSGGGAAGACGCDGSGTLGVGGVGSSCYYGGGGGGGYYGGGGAYGGGGGGGSSYPASNGGVISNLTHTQGYQNGGGYVNICAPATISGSTTVCTGATTSLTASTSGGSWSSSNSGVASVSGAGVVTGVSSGTVTISYSSTTACGPAVSTYAMTVNQTPGSISGTSTYCAGATGTLTASPSGGTWSSSNSSLASVSSSGVVTTFSAGTPTISYSFPGGCPASTFPLVVNTTPTSIVGASTVCGSLTTTLSDGISGGTWTSSNTTVAQVGSTGVVTGIGAGTATITYTLTGGCFTTAPMTVNALSAITGVPSVCNGYTTTLADGTSGGYWYSSNPSVATVGSTTGVVSSVSIGTTTISYNIPTSGCTATQVVAVTGVPGIFSVTGGGHFCTGGSGVSVGMASSTFGVSYQLYNGSTPVGSPIIGGGFSFNFPPATAAGTYGVIADPGTACAVTMSGSATITLDPLPTAFVVSGGGNYCAGGTGQHVYLNNSTIGINYQLFVNTGGGAVPVGGVVSGTGAALDFGAQTIQGTYTVVGTNASTSCINNMTGGVTIATNPLPVAYSVTPSSGGYCAGGSGVNVGTSNSETGISYQLKLGGSSVGSPVTGSAGTGVNFGLQTTPGTYTVVATNNTTGCTNTMTGSSIVAINPLPTVYTVTGGGSYCVGGAGVSVGLNGSQTGVNYQLFNGTSPTGTPVAGSGGSISFPAQTSVGGYTVVATSTSGCISAMSGSASVATNPAPTAFAVTGGGAYCTGGSGVHVGVASSVAGTNYQLFNGASLVTAASGTGAALDFGLITASGTYTVLATNTATGCTGSMTGSVPVTANPLPNAYSVTGGGSYCSGGTGVAIGLGSSQSSATYQLLRGGVPVGTPVSGTGSAISFGAQTVGGAYTVVATNTLSCSNGMTGSAAIIVNPLPTTFNVTGGGGYCAGAAGVHVGLSGSDLGVSYQLYNGSTATLAPITGVGAAIDFGVLSGTGTYTITATNSSTGCTKGMSGSAAISINPLPAAYTLSGGGSYCAGSTGVAINLGNSAIGINYQLMHGTTPVGTPVAGTGSGITFGPQTLAGSYTAVGTSSAGCASNMTGTVGVTVNPLPAVYTVSGTGSYCSGGSGLPVSLSGSVVGINYQLNYLGAPLGATQPGTGAPVVFGPVTGAGNYTITAINPATTCTNIMSGSASVSINPLPALYLVNGGGSYCSGGTGVHVGLSGSSIGVNYQLIAGGLSTGSPMPGTTSAIDFGPQTASGTYTVMATNTTTGCTQLMTGSSSVAINPLPTTHALTGGGNYCPGGTGVVIGLNGSDAGNTYQLYNGLTAVGSPVTGSGSTISFGLQTATGTYSVIATNTSTSCTGNMTGSATVGLNPLPTIYNVSGGGNYCPGGSGVHVGLSGTSVGVNYQLIRSGSPVSGTIAGTGFAVDFGLQTATGTYTIVGTNATTGCNSTMNGTAPINISALPAAHSVTGGGNFCSGGVGLHIGLDGSNTGASYQLYNGITAVGSPMAGTGLPLDFGVQPNAGTYTVVATGTTTSCSNTMTGSQSIVVNSLPAAYTVTGGGSYCSGGLGSDVMLSSSDPGTNYQLYVGGTAVGSVMAGTGSAIDFGPQTASGTYVVVATNATTSCTNSSSGTVSVSTNPPPTPYLVTGGGSYCTGGSGVHVMLGSSDVGTQYQLMLSGTPVGAPIAGTGFGLDFGSQTGIGSYTIQATNTANSCVGLMSGSATVSASALPAVYNVMASGSTFCTGGTGVDVTLNGSDLGTQYQLYNGTTTVGSPVAGTGLPIDFGAQTSGGTYTVVAVNTGTTCSSNMAGSAAISANPLPVAFHVTGGGSYCSGGTGASIGLGGSNVGVTYQLYSGGLPVGSSMSGTGSTLNFGPQTGAGSYTVLATNSSTGCTNTMSGTATVAINALPVSEAVTGGGNYCMGGSGVHVGIAGSSLGTTYQLMRGGSPVGSAVSGTGFSVDFGNQTTAGTYTIVATTTSNSCSRTMAGSAVVGVNAVPSSYSVTGGGSYCPGGAGVNVGLTGSATGISYQLFNGTTMVGSAMSGTGLGLSFGMQTGSGTYTVVATNTGTSCSSTMTGSANVSISSVPAVYNVVGGGSYCEGGTGVHIGLNSSATGISYQLYNGFTATGAPVIGSGASLDLGSQTSAGTYSVIATDPGTGCTSNMSGSAAVAVNPLVVPAVSISTGVGDTVCSGQTVTFTASPLHGGGSPSYQWTVNGVVAGVGSTYTFVPLNGDVVGVTLSSTASCATPSTATSSVGMTVYETGMPTVSVTAAPGTNVCAGTVVSFSASSTFGGSAPVYSWFKNNVNSGTGASYSTTPVDGDVIYAVLSSNYHCKTADNVQSSHLAMKVDAAVLPVVQVTAHPGNTIAPGESVTFVATVVSGGGPAPSYQWMVNGNAVGGANSSSYTTNNLSDGDSVTCEVLSSGGCAGMAGFNSVTIHVRGVGVQVLNTALGDVRLTPNPNNGTFNLKGSLATSTDEQMSYEVTDMIGQVVYRGQFIAHNGDINEHIQLSNAANGMYLLNLHSAAGNQVFHIVIEQ